MKDTVKTKFGSPVEIICELPPWKSNGKTYERVRGTVFGTHIISDQDMLVENLIWEKEEA